MDIALGSSRTLRFLSIRSGEDGGSRWHCKKYENCNLIFKYLRNCRHWPEEVADVRWDIEEMDVISVDFFIVLHMEVQRFLNGFELSNKRDIKLIIFKSILSSYQFSSHVNDSFVTVSLYLEIHVNKIFVVFQIGDVEVNVNSSLDIFKRFSRFFFYLNFSTFTYPSKCVSSQNRQNS